MRMFYCDGCESHHDSKDGYVFTESGKRYCTPMPEVTYSPKPWKMDPCWDVLSNGGGNGLVCRVTPGGSFFKDGEAEANGRLIEAAPDLLEALQNIMNGIASGAIKSDYDETMRNAVIHAGAAIAKATGAA